MISSKTEVTFLAVPMRVILYSIPMTGSCEHSAGSVHGIVQQSISQLIPQNFFPANIISERHKSKTTGIIQ